MILLRTVGIIQARTGSKRLSNKAALFLGKRTILEILLERLRASESMNEVVVATTTNQRDDIIERIASEGRFRTFRGSEDDVLDRYYNAARKFDAAVIVRITADNPLTDVSLADSQARYLVENNCDYVTTPKVLLGVGSEAISFHALEIAWKNATERYQREHVTPYIYENTAKFKVMYLDAPALFRQETIRLTIDRREDFEVFEALQNQFGDLVRVTTKDVIDFLLKAPQVRGINSGVQQKVYWETGD